MERIRQNPFIVIAGPTASGKTDVAVELALRLGGEVISADSMQVYRHLTIGTAKPEPAELRGVEYHLIDHVNPNDQYTMGRFVRGASELLEAITQQGKLPIVCGGTGLYLRGLIYGMAEERVVDHGVRERLDSRVASEGLPALYLELADVDAVSARKIMPNDRQRILRALEVYHTTGRPISSMNQHPMTTPVRACGCFYLNRPRAALYDRINRRVDLMIERGLVEEVKQYLQAGHSVENPAIKALGYSEIIAYIEGKQSLETAIDEMKKRTRHFAKRQETWFRGMPCFERIEVEEKSIAEIAEQVSALYAS